MNHILNTIFPKNCLGCNVEGVWLCQNCYNALQNKINAESFCVYCQTETKQMSLCGTCRKASNLDKIIFSLDYENLLLKNLIQTFKYNFIQELAQPLSALILTKINKLQIRLKPQQQILLPIPLHKKRLRWRGFNQAELLAKNLAEPINLPYYSSILTKTKPTKEQANLKGKARRKNLNNSFQAQFNSKLTNKTIILVDDVTTTHTTLEEVARVIKNSNYPKNIWGIVICC